MLQVPGQVVALAEALLAHGADVRAQPLVDSRLVLPQIGLVREAPVAVRTTESGSFRLSGGSALRLGYIHSFLCVLAFIRVLRFLGDGWICSAEEFGSQRPALRRRTEVRIGNDVCVVHPGVLPVNQLVSDEAGRLGKAPPALRAAVGPFVRVDAELVPPEVRYLLECLPAIATRLGLDGVHRKRHQGGRRESRVRTGRGIFGLRRLSSRCRAAPCRLHVEVFRVPLEEGLCGEGQLAVGAREDLRCCSGVTLYNLGENGENR